MPNEDKATRYHRARRRAAAIPRTLGVAGLLVGLASGASVWLREAALALAAVSGVPAGVVFGAVLTLCYQALRLPFDYHAGVVLDTRYGLSVQPRGGWWRERIARGGVAIACGAAVAGAVSWLLSMAPVWWWAFAAALAVLGLVAAAYLVPRWLAPTAAEVRALVAARPELVVRLRVLAERCGLPFSDPAIRHVAGHTRTAHASIVGVGRHRRIVLSDTLLAEHGDDEVEAIVAHELAHVVHHDTWAALAVQAAVVLSAALLADRTLSQAVSALALSAPSDLAALPGGVLGASVAWWAWQPAVNLCSRRQERRADRFAVEQTRNPLALAKALRHMGAVNLADHGRGFPGDLWWRGHPALGARIQAVEWLDRPSIGPRPAGDRPARRPG